MPEDNQRGLEDLDRAEWQGGSLDTPALPGLTSQDTLDTQAKEGRTPVSALPDPNGHAGISVVRVWGLK